MTMERCPACNAQVREKTVCRRCKTDLTLMIAVEDQAARHTDEADLAFQAGNYGRMFFHAKRACSLKSSPASRRLLAASALLTRRFETAVEIWKKQGKTL